VPKTHPMSSVPRELLGSLTPEEFRNLKRRIVAANKAMGYWYQQMGRDCTTMIDGHVSARVPGTETFVTRGRAPDRDLLSEVTLQKVVQIDILTRSKVAGEMEVTSMGEIELHACIYEARPDAVAVCHGHSDYVQLCGIFGLELKAFSIDGAEFVLDGYGLYDKPYMIASPETGIAMAEALGKYSAVLLAGHGSATVSMKGPEECVMKMMRLEQLCKMNWLAFTALGKEYQKYGMSETTLKEGQKLSRIMRERYLTPGKDRDKDMCYYNAAMVKTFREAVDG
jgi:ribulose-5-phosphate 4-epimerase/fuculose-1-phosphate aldolase